MSMSSDGREAASPRPTCPTATISNLHGSPSATFASPVWLEHLKRTLDKVVAERTDEERRIQFILCEVYQQPPAHIAPDGEDIAWHARFSPEGVSFELTDCPEAAMRIEGDYALIAQLGKIFVGGDAEARRRLRYLAGLGEQAGQLRTLNRLGFRPAFLQAVHDEMARMTD